VHEEREDRVGEEVLAGAVGRGREAGALEGIAEDDRVHVGQVGRQIDGRPALDQAPQLGERALDEHLVREGVEADELRGVRHEPGQGARREQCGHDRRDEARRKLEDARVEVAGDVPAVAFGEIAEARAALLVGHPPERASEPLPLGELLLIAQAARSREALGLVVGGVIEGEERILRAGDGPLDHRPHDVGAGVIEPEDRSARLHRAKE
jgi:hypothetical protein